jgi:hypothetical protein
MVVNESEVVPGATFYLPAKDELPPDAVLPVLVKPPTNTKNSKEFAASGFYNRHVVIVSRPADEEGMIHFHNVGLSSIIIIVCFSLIPARSPLIQQFIIGHGLYRIKNLEQK